MSIVRTDAVTRQLDDSTFAEVAEDIDNKPTTRSYSELLKRFIECVEAFSPEHVYKASLRLVDAGLSIIPIACDGSKSPDWSRLPSAYDPRAQRYARSWSAYEVRRPSHDELRRWFEAGGLYGLAVVGGCVSGGACGVGLEILDFDTAELAEPWMKAVEHRAPGLVERLVRVQTPRPGLHVYYRCSLFGNSKKLAFVPATDVNGRPCGKAVIEVKAEGGYCLAPGSPASCHPTRRLYQCVDGSPDLTAVPTLKPEERGILMDAAQALSQWKEPKKQSRTVKRVRKCSGLLLPGDDFNARANWHEILVPHGWTEVGTCGEETRWCRPDKIEQGISATTNHDGNDRLHVFTTSAYPLEEGNYDKFAAYTRLNHDGDFKKAASKLREEGYGAKTLKGGKR